MLDFLLATQPKEWQKLKQHHGAARTRAATSGSPTFDQRAGCARSCSACTRQTSFLSCASSALARRAVARFAAGAILVRIGTPSIGCKPFSLIRTSSVPSCQSISDLVQVQTDQASFDLASRTCNPLVETLVHCVISPISARLSRLLLVALVADYAV